MSRTPAACDSKPACSRPPEPNSFTSVAPDTLKRSVIWVFIAALCAICCREMPCRRRPTRRAGMMNTGSTTKVSSVSRHSSASIAPRVVSNTITLLTTLPSVLVTAVCAPITSLLRRDVIEPVGVRVKNAIGMRCTLANSERRRSKISPSPTRALHQRCTMARPASATAAATAIEARMTICRLSPCGIAVSMIALNTKRSDEGEHRRGEDRREEQRDRLLVRAGERPDAPKGAVLQLDTLHGVDVTLHHRMWRHSHAVTLRAASRGIVRSAAGLIGRTLEPDVADPAPATRRISAVDRLGRCRGGDGSGGLHDLAGGGRPAARHP